MQGRGIKKHLAGEAGFTLPEILVVLIIIGTLAAVATISLNRNMAHWELVTAARTMVSDIRETRDEAITSGTGAEVWFYRDWDYYERRHGGVVREEVYLPVRVRFAYIKGFNKLTLPVASAVYQLHFGPSGNPSLPGGSVYLKNKAEEKYQRVAVLSATGRVRITEEAPP